jgi:hypothetical protein
MQLKVLMLLLVQSKMVQQQLVTQVNITKGTSTKTQLDYQIWQLIRDDESLSITQRTQAK